MDKQFIPYEQALELKELGFDEPCFGWFRTIDFKEYFLETELDLDEEFSDLINSNFTGGACSAPLYQQAFRWFRDKHNIYSYIQKFYYNRFDYVIIDEKNDEEVDYNDSLFNTYEEAELACLKKLIEIVKNK